MQPSLKYGSFLLILETMHLLEAWGYVLSPCVLSHVSKVSLTCTHVNKGSGFLLPLYQWLYLDNNTTKVKKSCLSPLCVFSWDLIVCQLFFSALHQNAARVRAECTILSSKQKSLNLFHLLCLSKLWFNQNGTWYEYMDMNFEWKQTFCSSRRAAPLRALLN